MSEMHSTKSVANPMLRGSTERETCDLNGWGVGTRLIGDEGYGPTIIEITAVGKRSILAETVTHNGSQPRGETEGLWTLTCRDWTRVTPPAKPEETP